MPPRRGFLSRGAVLRADVVASTLKTGDKAMPNPDRYFDDLQVGEVSTGAPILITDEDIMAFGRVYDPQPFHTDPDAAASSRFGSLIASGWHVATLVIKQMVETKPFGSTPVIGIGVDELRWRQAAQAIRRCPNDPAGNRVFG
jgi:acyl dehydratase